MKRVPEELSACRDMIPAIRRARDYHLYDCSGKRYLDLYLNGGRCLLGHRPEGVFNVLKNSLSKGPAAEYPNLYLSRYMKLLSRFFPDYRVFRIYSSWERAVDAVGRFLQGGEVTVCDPLICEKFGPVRLWRPFSPPGEDAAEVILPVIPFPSGSAPVTVCFRDGNPPESDPAAPFFLAALSRTLGALEHFSSHYKEELWKAFDGPELWGRKGPYLVFRITGLDYETLFGEMLDEGILLPPCENAIAVIPGNFTAGEISPIIKAAKRRGV